MKVRALQTFSTPTATVRAGEEIELEGPALAAWLAARLIEPAEKRAPEVATRPEPETATIAAPRKARR